MQCTVSSICTMCPRHLVYFYKVSLLQNSDKPFWTYTKAFLFDKITIISRECVNLSRKIVLIPIAVNDFILNKFSLTNFNYFISLEIDYNVFFSSNI